MSRFVSISFGACQVYVAQREIRLQGRVQSVPRKAFDLLLCLLDRHDEVVSKADLSRLVGRERAISDKVMSKAVMQLRMAIGDSLAEPAWIKTVHGVGYRFVGQVVTHAAGSPPAAVPQPTSGGAGAALRLALMPFDNCTGEPTFVWVELGLAMLVLQALEGDVRLVPVPLPTVLKALDAVPPSATQAERAAALQRALGAHCVVHAVLQRKDGGLQLDYRSYGLDERPLTGSVSGDEAVQLGEALAQRLADGLFPTRPRTVRFESDDPFFNQLMARATQLFAQRQLQEVVQILRAARVFEPDSVGARLLLVQTLVRRGDSACFALGEELLAMAREHGDERLQGMVHGALLCMVLYRDFELARQHLVPALHFGRRYPNEEWAVRTQLVAALEAAMRHDVETSRGLFTALRHARLQDQDEMNWVAVTMNFATFNSQIGDLRCAQSLLEEALPVAQAHGWRWIEAAVLSNLAGIHAEFGRMAIGLQWQLHAETLAASLQDETYMRTVLDSATVVREQSRRLGGLEVLLRQWIRLESSEQPMSRAFFRWAKGELAAAAGQRDAARRLMREALALAVEAQYSGAIHAWLVRLLQLELQAGAHDNARAVCREMEALAAFDNHPDLQAWVLHAQAADLHAQGQPASALQTLQVAVRSSMPGRANAYARLAAAWLLLEQERVAEARALVEPIAPWLDEYPVGICVAARLRFAEGDVKRAAALQRRAAALWADKPEVSVLLCLQSAYKAFCDAADTGAGTAVTVLVPALPRLVTLL